MTKNRSCPVCRAVNHDKKGDHLFLMDDGKFWHCNKPYHDPYFEPADGTKSNFKPKQGGNFQSVMNMKDVEELPYPSDNIRGINTDTSEYYGVKVEYDTTSGEIVKHYYPHTQKQKGNGHEVVAYKIRSLPKDFSKCVGELGKATDFWGMSTVKRVPDVLVITEGELDAMSAYQMLKNYGTPCISVPHGAGSGQATFVKHKDWLGKIPKIVVAYDMDEEGENCTAKIAKLFPDIYVMEYSEKDANAMLMTGQQDEFINAFMKASKWKPKCIIPASAVKTQAIQPVVMGLSYPFSRLTQITYGSRLQRLIMIGAGPGTGKTTFMNQLLSWLAYEHGEVVTCLALEDSTELAMKKLVGCIMKQPIHIPGYQYDIKEAQKVADTLDDKVFFYNVEAYNGTYEEIEDVVRYCAAQGQRYFFIDPISGLVSHLDDQKVNTFLNKAFFKLSRLVRELDITIFCISHLNNPKTGKDHGEGGHVTGGQFSGSRAQYRFSTELWGLERDQQSQDPNERDTVTVRVIKDRLAGLTGTFKLKYNRDKGVLEEVNLFSAV